MKVAYAPRALRDIEEILSYIYERSPEGARSVSFAIEHTIDICAQNPLAGAAADEPRVYRWPLGKYRYTIYYRLSAAGDAIEIARVVHAARIRDLRRIPSYIAGYKCR